MTCPSNSTSVPGEHLVTLAQAIAADAHQGQVDKAGRPYIEHPQRVAARVADDPLAAATAWLHDVVEDTPWTLQALDEAGVPTSVLEAVDALTKREGEPAASYYARVRQNPLARRVKLADLDDNSDAQRLDLLPPETQERLRLKYEGARRALA